MTARGLIAAAMRMLPRRRRFGAAMALARAAEPLMRRTKAYRLQALSRVDGPQEIAAHLLLHMLTRHDVEFDPVVDVRGYAELARTYRDGNGILLAAPHAALGMFLFRLFHDGGLPMVTITGEPERIQGTPYFTPTIQPSPSFLLEVRTRLRRGEIVGCMLDRAEHQGGRTFEVESGNGPIIVAPALLHVAVRCGARVAFTEMHVDGARLAGTIAMAKGRTVEELTEEFVAFVRASVAARFGAAPAANLLLEPTP